MVNVAVLAARLEKLREYLEILRSVQHYDLERFKSDPFVHGAAERYLHLSIECLIDIGNHIISDRGYKKPDSYAEVFQVLSAEGVLPSRILGGLEGMAAFRNVLVHDYLRLDRDRVYQIIKDKVPVMEEVAAIYADLL